MNKRRARKGNGNGEEELRPDPHTPAIAGHSLIQGSTIDSFHSTAAFESLALA